MNLRTNWTIVGALAAGVAFSVGLPAQEATPSPPPPTASQEPEASRHEQVTVIAPTPLEGVGVDPMRFPANVQHLDAKQLGAIETTDATDALDHSVAGLHRTDPQGNGFAEDVFFRGFEVSPLLGTPQGLSVYQDGVRLNEVFGDTVHWDLLPLEAFSTVDVIPGSDPLFGLNTLGGAISIRTKNGFNSPSDSIELAGGSYGRRSVTLESGRHGSALGYYLAADWLAEDGWRDFSPSSVRRAFLDLSWRSGESAADLSVGIGADRLGGNGTAPENLLDADRSAIFTAPDVSKNQQTAVALRWGSPLSAQTRLLAVASIRWMRPETFNGDASPFGTCTLPANAGGECRDPGDREQPLHDQFGRAVPNSIGDAVDNQTTTSERQYGATLQLENDSRLFGFTQHLVAGLGIEYGDANYTSATALGAFDASRTFVDSGLVAVESAIHLKSSTTDGSLFLSDFLSLSPRLDLALGARWDHSRTTLADQIGTALNGDHSNQRVNPSVGLTFQLPPAVALFARYAESSRTPTPVEWSCADPENPCRLPNEFVSDPPLREVVAHTVEVGVRGRGRGGLGAWSAALFRTTTDDDILFISSGPGRSFGHFANVGKTERAGLELSINGKIGRWSWSAGYSLTRAVFDSDFDESSPNHPMADADGVIHVTSGDRLAGVPLHNLKAGIVYASGSRWDVGLDLLFRSSEFLRGDEANLLPPIGSQLTADLQVQYALPWGVTAFARVTNLFNSSFDTFGELSEAEPVLPPTPDNRFVSPGAPRQFLAGLRFSR